MEPGKLLVPQCNEWRRFPFLDPRPPAELLPDGWIGDRARELFTARHTEWAEPAQRRWRELAHDRPA